MQSVKHMPGWFGGFGEEFYVYFDALRVSGGVYRRLLVGLQHQEVVYGVYIGPF